MGYEDLAIAIYKQAVRDYKAYLEMNNQFRQKQVKEFLTSGRYGISPELGEKAIVMAEKEVEEGGGRWERKKRLKLK